MLALDELIVNPDINNLPLHHHPVLKNGVCQVANDYMIDNFAEEDVYTSMMILK